MEPRQLSTAFSPVRTTAGPARRTTGPSARRRAGFTLIELLVVLLILTITIGIVSVNLGGSDTDRVRDEADRLVALLTTARDEAILQGQYFAVQFQADGYRFLRVDAKGQLAVIESDDTFRPRRLPEGMTLSVALDGAAAGDEAGLVLEPSGQLPPFLLTFRLGEVRWYAVNENAGRLQSRATPEAERAG